MRSITVSYPNELPISSRVPEIVDAIRDHQVVIVSGETGSGKSTQLPKICLEAERGTAGLIGHTQPRRIAARAVAERVAEEMGTELGGLVGYSVRFTDRVGPNTVIRLMTDGILLAELQRDPRLRRYDTIIVDEAHERSLNIDFILGYLRELLPERPDLKVIVTSATIDTERFARHFGGAPVVEVSGRTYPVEVRYRPLDDPDDQTQGICEAVEELWTEGSGDVLVFLSGQREIRDAEDALRGLKLPDTEILPLYARLSAAEQHRVFAPHDARRIVLATNVAETSLTVPGIRSVVDPGTARISRYSLRRKVQRLPIEPVSQASANQRAGRCGRIAPGVCIRLYSEEDFEARPAFTEPEVLRTNLASVILQMSALGLGDVADFPFLEAPDRRNIAAGIELLTELGAIDARGDLTGLGRKLARLPLDPRLARMVLEAGRNGCVSEVAVIAAALSIQNPRERPADKQKAADEAHARFAEPSSDFLSLWNLWRYLQERQRELSSSRFRKLCKSEFLHYLRVREWQDVAGQIRSVAKELGLSLNREPAQPEAIHRSLLAGLLSHIGMRDGQSFDYIGARGSKFALSPGSVLFEKAPRWIMAAEIVETTRPWAHVAARIKPEWAEPLAKHLLTYEHGEPYWAPARGCAVADRTVRLYGLPIVRGRKIDYDRVDAGTARELFVLHALVRGEWRRDHGFLRHNREVLDEVRALEDRLRTRSVAIGEDELFDFYEARIPVEATSGRTFDEWWERARVDDPHLLDLTVEQATASSVDVSPDDFPEEWHQDDLTFPVSYTFDPQAAADGVNVHIPLELLGRVRPHGFDWNVPGLREQVVDELIRSLPKDERRRFPSPNEQARRFLEAFGPSDGPLIDTLAEALGVSASAFGPERLSAHLQVTFLVHDADGTVIAEGEDIEAVREMLRPELREAVSDAASDLERTGLTDWVVGALPQRFETAGGGIGFPALVDDADSVAVRVLESRRAQARAMRAGTRRLLLLRIAPRQRDFELVLDDDVTLALSRQPGSFEDCVAAAVDRLVREHGGPAWNEEDFRDLQRHVRYGLMEAVEDTCGTVADCLVHADRLEARVKKAPIPDPAAQDITDQLSRLVRPGFAVRSGAHLEQLPRYLEAIEHRLRKLATDPVRDDELMLHVQALEDRLDELAEAGADRGAVREIDWMLEELRVSLFAQHLGTAQKVSEKRIRARLADLG